MSVNPNLETLMSLVEDLQDQMPEGKYLEAMNALRDLHRNAPPPRPESIPWQPSPGQVRLSNAEWIRFRGMQEARNTWYTRRPEAQKVYRDWVHIRELCDEKNITEREWVAMEYEDRIDIIHRALFKLLDAGCTPRNKTPNPDANECPFISRHSVGRWDVPSDPRGMWSCVCGAKHLRSKNWEKHESSEKHQAWHKAGRRVSTQKTKEMKGNTYLCTNPRTILGWTMVYYSYPHNVQDINEWTHPQSFARNIPPPNAPKWSAQHWARAKPLACRAPEITCNHDPLSPEDQAKYGKAEYLEIPPHLPNHRIRWWNNEQIVELSDGGYQVFLAMAE
jgi:hypothetical protein